MTSKLEVFEIIKGGMRYTVAAASEEIGAHLLGCTMEQFKAHGSTLEDENCERYKVTQSKPEAVFCERLPKQNPYVFKKA
ncbi:hypothetical protein QTV43_000115 [Vibrio vulnificus]|nr:hypothetical protein [Vibrio vulnificus]